MLVGRRHHSQIVTVADLTVSQKDHRRRCREIVAERDDEGLLKIDAEDGDVHAKSG